MPNNAAKLQHDLICANPKTGGRGLVEIGGDWTIDRAIIWPNGAGLTLRGESMHGTKLHWVGPPDEPMFVRRDVRDSVIEELYIVTEQPLRAVCETGTLDPSTPGRTVTTHNQTRRIFVDSNQDVGTYHQYGGTGYDGFVYPDVNNEANVDEDIHANGVHIGIEYHGHQCKANHINRCRFQGQGAGLYGVVAWGGSFKADLCGGGGFLDAFFRIYNQTDSILIDWPDVESSARLLHTTGPTGGKTGSPQPIDIRGGRYMSDLMPPDRFAVLVQHGGRVRLQSIVMGGPPTIPIVRADGFRSHLSAHNVVFASPGSTPENSFQAGGDVYFDIGMNTYHRPADDPVAPNDAYDVRGIPGLHPITNEYQHGHVDA